MELRESIHNELINIYQSKNETIQERYDRYFKGKDITTESDVEQLGYFFLKESYENKTLNENFFTNLFSNFGGNVEQQLKEWMIGKAMDWFVKPFLGKIGGQDGQMYENIKKYVQITFAEMPFTEIVSTVTDCEKMIRLMTYGLFEYLLDKMLTNLNLDGVIVDNIRQELDRTFIEQSGIANKIASVVDNVVCGKSQSLKDRLSGFDLDFSFE